MTMSLQAAKDLIESLGMRGKNRDAAHRGARARRREKNRARGVMAFFSRRRNRR